MTLEPNPSVESVWWEEDKHYAMPGGYGATPAERLDALYVKLCAHDQSPDVPSASELAKADISVSTHGRVKVKGKITHGTRRGSGWRVTIDGKKHCVKKLVKRVWLSPPHKTNVRYELWSCGPEM